MTIQLREFLPELHSQFVCCRLQSGLSLWMVVLLSLQRGQKPLCYHGELIARQGTMIEIVLMSTPRWKADRR